MRRILLITSMVASVACGDDGDAPSPDGGTDAGGSTDAATGDGAADTGTADAGTDTGMADGGEQAPEERGEYLVTTVAICIDCHTPRDPETGALDMSRFLAGAECFIDVAPDDENAGCIHTPNLTNHETGLMNRSDAQIKRMFTEGVRPNDTPLHNIMPYWLFGNMTESDQDAVVAFLRTVPGVDHTVPPHQPPFDEPPPAATPVLSESDIPAPRADYADPEAAMRGRYLAAKAGVCIECHTEMTAPGTPVPIDLSMAMQGGRDFEIPGLGTVTSANLTPHATGLAGWSVEDIVRALRMGLDTSDERLCPPMPAGPMGPFVNLTDGDAMDLAHYLLSLEPAENMINDTCALPAM